MNQRFRLRFTFWLDLHKADEAQLAKTIDGLKQERSFASTIRDGIRLVCDLRAGRLDVLCELFPWVQEALQPVPAASVDARLHEQIARLETLLLAQGNVPIQTAASAEHIPARPPRKTRTPQVEITGTGKASPETVAKNFLNSMKGLASGLFD